LVQKTKKRKREEKEEKIANKNVHGRERGYGERIGNASTFLIDRERK
jgi:hypothetical protein